MLGNVGMRRVKLKLVILLVLLAILKEVRSHGEQPLSRIAIDKAAFALHDLAYVKASPTILGARGETAEWVTLEFGTSNPSIDDWIGVFSPANFSATTCYGENQELTHRFCVQRLSSISMQITPVLSTRSQEKGCCSFS